MENEEIIRNTLLEALNVTYDPNASNASRSRANATIQSFEANSKTHWPMCFQFSNRENPFPLRHFGLHLLESFIKYHWNEAKESDRREVRQRLMNAIKNDILDISAESLYVKECYAKCLTEIAKKEFPQKWSRFFDDCNDILSAGLSQCQIILLAWIRLLEDVIVLQNVEPSARRRDLHNTLINQIDRLLDPACKILSEIWLKLCNNEDESALKLCLTDLELLSIVLETIPASDFVPPKFENLFDIFCQLINDRRLSIRKSGSDCFGRFVIAKSTKKEVEIAVGLAVFTTNRMKYISHAVNNTLKDTIVNDEGYDCLRKFAYMLNSFGTNLSSCWNSDIEKDTDKVEAMNEFFNIIFTLFRHPSLVLRSQIAAILSILTKNDDFTKSNLCNTLLPRLIESIPVVIQLLGFPSKDDSLYSQYSRLDYDSDSDFLLEFCRFREMCVTMLRKSVKIDYKFAYRLITDWFLQKFDKNLESLTNHEWDAMIRFISNSMNTIVKMDVFNSEEMQKDSKMFIDIAMNNLKNKATANNADFILSTLSCLFPYLVFHFAYVPDIVVQLFRLVLWEDDGTENVRRLRHHAMHEFVHLALEQTDRLLPYLDDIVAEMEKHVQVLTLRQKCCLAEAFAVISNRFQDFRKQKRMVEYCISSSIQFFASNDIQNACANPTDFGKYIGLFDFTYELVTSDCVYFNRRKDILSHTIMLVGVLSRLRLPRNSEKAKEYGFAIDLDGKMMLNHPAFEISLPILPQLFGLARCVNGLCRKEVIANIHPTYGGWKILDLIDIEKHFYSMSVISTQSQDKDEQTMADQLRCFVADFTEKIQFLLGLVVSKFDWQFYQLPQASNYFVYGVLGFLDDCLDQRLRFWIRRFFLPVVESMETAHRHVILPALSILINHVFDRLTNRWSLILRRLQENDTSGKTSDDLTNQEIFLEDLTRLFTREYFIFLKSALYRASFNQRSTKNGSRDDDNGQEANNELVICSEQTIVEEHENCNVEMDHCGEKSKNDPFDLASNDQDGHLSKLSELGVDLLDQKHDCMGSLTLTVFHALTWLDTQTVSKACELGIVVLKQLHKTKMLDEQKVEHLFKCPLNSVQIHGEHDLPFANLLSLLCDMYEFLSPEFPCVKRILLAIPGCTSDKLEAYDAKLEMAKSTNVLLSVKFRRDSFKKLICAIIGTNIGQKYKSDVTYNMKLPIFVLPHPKYSKDNRKNNSNANSGYNDIGICSLFGH